MSSSLLISSAMYIAGYTALGFSIAGRSGKSISDACIAKHLILRNPG